MINSQKPNEKRLQQAEKIKRNKLKTTNKNGAMEKEGMAIGQELKGREFKAITWKKDKNDIFQEKYYYKNLEPTSTKEQCLGACEWKYILQFQ